MRCVDRDSCRFDNMGTSREFPQRSLSRDPAIPLQAAMAYIVSPSPYLHTTTTRRVYTDFGQRKHHLRHRRNMRLPNERRMCHRRRLRCLCRRGPPRFDHNHSSYRGALFLPHGSPCQPPSRNGPRSRTERLCEQLSCDLSGTKKRLQFAHDTVTLYDTLP